MTTQRADSTGRWRYWSSSISSPVQLD
jgi:hypothetical protein